MALIQCKECGHTIGTDASTCPSCGVSRGRRRSGTLATIAVVVALIAAVAGYSLAHFYESPVARSAERAATAKENDKPSRNDVLSVAQELASATAGTVETNGRLEKPFAMIEVTDVTIKGMSTESSVCLVVADVQVRYLDGFSRATYVRAKGFHNWFPHVRDILARYDSEGKWYGIDPTWKSAQANKAGLTLSDVKMYFRRFDTGWRFERANILDI